MIPNRLRLLWRNMGLGQTRCANCLAPFTPAAPSNALDAPKNGPAGVAAPLCPQCSILFTPYKGPRCPYKQTRCRGAFCRQNPPSWDSIAAYGLYQSTLRDALLRLKFDGALFLAPLLGACLLEASCCLPRPDALTAVPQHPVHLRRRGFNQAHELAKALHKFSGIPLQTELLRRRAPHIPQTGLSAAERRRNKRHAFHAPAAAKDMRVWLIDDVMTTGITLSAAAHALCAAGAQGIYVLIVARTPLHS
ncbi:amidophosphoribosyltransferase [Deltaproteobacteria bacterium]|nr:amidophosphoribosyltransferase [Deltaproteobacteria bacterium]